MTCCRVSAREGEISRERRSEGASQSVSQGGSCVRYQTTISLFILSMLSSNKQTSSGALAERTPRSAPRIAACIPQMQDVQAKYASKIRKQNAPVFDLRLYIRTVRVVAHFRPESKPITGKIAEAELRSGGNLIYPLTHSFDANRVNSSAYEP